jgi:hypothetical protein
MQVIPMISVIALLLVVSIGISPVYANGFSFSESNFLFKIQNVIEDIRISIASPTDKITLIKEFALDKQTIIDTKTKIGEKVPLDVEERRLALIEKTDNIEESVDVITQLKDELNQLGEMNEIRILYSQFEDCKINCTEQQLQDFNDKVNALDSWNNKCQGTFDIDDFDYSLNSFDKLSSKCPDLYQFSKNHLRIAVNGD